MQHDLDDIGGARELVWRRINVAKDDLEAAEMNMHIVLYGDLDQNGVTFADPSKETLLMLPALAMEQDYMLQAAEKFDELRNTFVSVEEFEAAIAANPSQYGAELPDVVGYTYSESDQEEYYRTFARSSNQTIQNEIQNMENSLESIEGKKFPSALPVLTLLSSDNVEAMPIWKTAHEEQLNLDSANHKLYIVEGSHYIWYTNLMEIVKHIFSENNF